MRGRRRTARKIAKRLRRCWADHVPHRIGTLLRAVGALRSSWRAACPLREDRSRSTGWDLPHKGRGIGPDYFLANRLAMLAWRATWARRDFDDPAPPTDWGLDAETRGARRKLR